MKKANPLSVDLDHATLSKLRALLRYENSAYYDFELSDDGWFTIDAETKTTVDKARRREKDRPCRSEMLRRLIHRDHESLRRSMM
jgi:hypothetical protein